MADKKVDAATGEVKELGRGPAIIGCDDTRKVIPDRYKEMLDQAVEEKECVEHEPILRVHCKPVYNYQSVEFDVEVHKGLEEVDFAYMENLYKGMLEMLVRVSQNAPQAEAKKPAAPVEEPATEAQKQILRNFHIDFKPDITKKQAHALIKKSMDQEIF